MSGEQHILYYIHMYSTPTKRPFDLRLRFLSALIPYAKGDVKGLEEGLEKERGL